MKLVNPIGRSVQQADSGTVQPRGCTCNTTLNDMTAMRKVAGSCSRCHASCQGHTNGEANATVAQKKTDIKVDQGAVTQRHKWYNPRQSLALILICLFKPDN